MLLHGAVSDVLLAGTEVDADRDSQQPSAGSSNVCACAGHDHAAQVGRRGFAYSEEAAQLPGQYASHHMGQTAWGWLPGQARRQPAAQSGPLPGQGAGLGAAQGAEPMEWQRQGVSTLDLRSRPPRQRELERRGRDRSGAGFSRGGSGRAWRDFQDCGS